MLHVQESEEAWTWHRQPFPAATWTPISHTHSFMYAKPTAIRKCWYKVYIFLFAPSVLFLCLLSPPSVCSQCQPLISSCKVSVVRSPCLDTAVESNTVERRGGGANSLRFVCQVCRCYATHLRVKVKPQEMQRCDFIYQWDQCFCLSAQAAPRSKRLHNCMFLF